VKKLLRAFLLSLLVFVMYSPRVHAIALPDTGPFILSVNAYTNYLELGDTLIGIFYNDPYTVLPTETITESMIARFVDNTTELARAAPYAYVSKGYGLGMVWMYLDAASSPSWGGNYTIEFTGNPTLSWPGGLPPNVSTTAITWRTTAIMDATKILIRAHVLSWAATLGNSWSLALVSNPATGTVLSAYGEAYFVNVIPQVRTTVPTLFSQSVQVATHTDTSSNQTQAKGMKARWPLDWTGVSAWLGLPSEEVLRTGFILFIVGMVTVPLVRINPTWGIFTAFLCMPLIAITGGISVIWAVLLAFGVIFAIGFVLFILRGAG
jgi:hypothetical protein